MTMTEDAGPTKTRAATRDDLIARTWVELEATWKQYVTELPPEHEEWTLGAAYIRESSAHSTSRDMPTTQLTIALGQLARRQVFVPWEGVFFDQATGTEISARRAFRSLFEDALRGKYRVIGAYVSNRLFRNAREAQDVKREFMVHGIELDYLGKFTGDPRSAMAWRIERTQEIDDELWARTTSENVGRALEALSAKGQPIGRLPEGYVVGERAPSFMGQPGRILTYVRNEPLATIIAQAAELYLDGYSYTQLAVWSENTELKGRTAAGRVMNALWWRQTLLNPKYAGHHMPSAYPGFKPGKESPARPRRKNGSAVLVPCRVPALYALDTWERMVRISASRKCGTEDSTAIRSLVPRQSDQPFQGFPITGS
jgi:DNA invertase Pin-like site-specific DNA recombinase